MGLGDHLSVWAIFEAAVHPGVIVTGIGNELRGLAGSLRAAPDVHAVPRPGGAGAAPGEHAGVLVADWALPEAAGGAEAVQAVGASPPAAVAPGHPEVDRRGADLRPAEEPGEAPGVPEPSAVRARLEGGPDRAPGYARQRGAVGGDLRAGPEAGLAARLTRARQGGGAPGADAHVAGGLLPGLPAGLPVLGPVAAAGAEALQGGLLRVRRVPVQAGGQGQGPAGAGRRGLQRPPRRLLGQVPHALHGGPGAAAQALGRLPEVGGAGHNGGPGLRPEPDRGARRAGPPGLPALQGAPGHPQGAAPVGGVPRPVHLRGGPVHRLPLGRHGCLPGQVLEGGRAPPTARPGPAGGPAGRLGAGASEVGAQGVRPPRLHRQGCHLTRRGVTRYHQGTCPIKERLCPHPHSAMSRFKQTARQSRGGQSLSLRLRDEQGRLLDCDIEESPGDTVDVYEVEIVDPAPFRRQSAAYTRRLLEAQKAINLSSLQECYRNMGYPTIELDHPALARKDGLPVFPDWYKGPWPETDCWQYTETGLRFIESSSFKNGNSDPTFPLPPLRVDNSAPVVPDEEHYFVKDGVIYRSVLPDCECLGDQALTASQVQTMKDKYGYTVREVVYILRGEERVLCALSTDKLMSNDRVITNDEALERVREYYRAQHDQRVYYTLNGRLYIVRRKEDVPPGAHIPSDEELRARFGD
eukprot:768373-Hanusia_phi.AAC.24